jgi:hypothetical protein
MLKIKNLRGECQHCGEPIEFHAEHAGSTAECPHCGRLTDLLLAPPPDEESPVRRKALVFSLIAILILIGGLLATTMALRRAQNLKAKQQQTTVTEPLKGAAGDSFLAQGFQVSAVTLERQAGGAMVYAVGTIRNVGSRQRFGVKVELELFDEAGNKLGGASDYQKVLEPNAEWKFRALVTNRQVVAARLSRILEAQ